MNWSWWYLVLLIPLAMLILIAMASCKQSSQLRMNWSWLIGLVVIGLVGWTIWWFINRPANPVTENKPPTNSETTDIRPTGMEVLVPTETCWTPCSAYVGWGYKVRTDGDPLQIKYQGCDWFDQPGKGDFSAPKGFRPGNAQFVSGDKEHLNVRVQIYRKVKL